MLPRSQTETAVFCRTECSSVVPSVRRLAFLLVVAEKENSLLGMCGHSGNVECVCLSPGGLFFWGATNTSRESTMYPKAVQDLCGWRIRSLACGYVTVSPGEDVCPLPGPGGYPRVGASSLERLHFPLPPRFPPAGHQMHESSGGEGLLGARGLGRF